MKIENKAIDTNIDKLRTLERTHAITIGLDRSYANNLWQSVTIIGKILNLLTPLLIIVTTIVFIKVGILQGLLSVFLVGVYVVIVQKVALLYVRVRLLFIEDGYFFKDAYTKRKATIRNNVNGKIISSPMDWVKLVL